MISRKPDARDSKKQANDNVGNKISNASGGHFERDLTERYLHLGITARCDLIHRQGDAVEIQTHNSAMSNSRVQQWLFFCPANFADTECSCRWLAEARTPQPPLLLATRRSKSCPTRVRLLR